AGLADLVRLVDVYVPAIQVGRGNSLRAQPSVDCKHGRVSYDRARDVAVVAGPPAMDETPRRCGAWRGNRAGYPRRPHGDLLSAGGYLDRARRPRRNLFLHHGRD